jgi:hypothetical protein
MYFRDPLKRAAMAALSAGVAALLLAAPAGAETFTPTRFDDPDPGRCRPGNCSLREAISASNNHPGHDTVLLSRGTYELEIPPVDTGFESGSFDLVDGMTLRGQGPGKTTIDGNELDKVLQGALNLAPDAFELVGLTVTGGNAGADPHSSGGGIDLGSFQDDLTLRRVRVTDNVARENGGGLLSRAVNLTIVHSRIVENGSARGGGIAVLPDETRFTPTATATIRASVISDNTAFFGGGLYGRAGSLTIHNTTIAGNVGDEGGGMDLISQPTAPPVTEIRSSTISGNRGRKGGGLLVDGNQPILGLRQPIVTLTNTTVAGNTTTGDGGGIMADNAATVNLDNSTIAYNRADSDDNGGVGGGIFQHSGAISSLHDSIIARNVVGTGDTPQQCEGAFMRADGLVREQQHAGTCSFEGDFRLVDDALIGPLADNGGPTQTVKLLAGSPALGFAHSCTKRDQRTVRRPPEGCDSGSFERRGP